MRTWKCRTPERASTRAAGMRIASAVARNGGTAMVLDSQRWKCVEAVPPILFSIEGLSAVRGREPGRRGWLTVAEGRVDDGARPPRRARGRREARVRPAAADRSPAAAWGVREADAERRACQRGTARADADHLGRRRGDPRLVARFGPAGQALAAGSTRACARRSRSGPTGPWPSEPTGCSTSSTWASTSGCAMPLGRFRRALRGAHGVRLRRVRHRRTSALDQR